MLVTLLGITNLVSFLPTAYCIKVFPSFVYELPFIDLYALLFSSTVILVKEVQCLNASEPMLVTLLPITTLVKDEQPKNAFSPILVTLSGITTLVKDPQLQNAELPMLVTLLGITTLVMEMHM